MNVSQKPTPLYDRKNAATNPRPCRKAKDKPAPRAIQDLARLLAQALARRWLEEKQPQGSEAAATTNVADDD